MISTKLDAVAVNWSAFDAENSAKQGRGDAICNRRPGHA
jgi:hypothetical protein